MFPVTTICFRQQEPVAVDRKKYDSITLREKQIDAAVWKALSSCTVDHLNLCKCNVVSWEGFRSCMMSALCLDDVSGLSAFSKSAGGKTLRMLILSNCNIEMCTALFPIIGQLHIAHLKIRDVDALFLTHLAFSPHMALKSVVVSRTNNHANENFAIQFIEKIAQLALDEFGWLESGLGDKLIDVLEKTRDAPWNIRLLDFRNNNLSLDAFERIEEFKQHAPGVQNIDVSENNIPLHLSASINTEPSEVEEESSVDEGMDVEEDEREEEVAESVAEDDDGETSSRVLAVEEGRRREKRETLPRAKSMTLEALTARYLRSIEKIKPVKPPRKRKRI